MGARLLPYVPDTQVGEAPRDLEGEPSVSMRPSPEMMILVEKESNVDVNWPSNCLLEESSEAAAAIPRDKVMSTSPFMEVASYEAQQPKLSYNKLHHRKHIRRNREWKRRREKEASSHKPRKNKVGHQT